MYEVTKKRLICPECRCSERIKEFNQTYKEHHTHQIFCKDVDCCGWKGNFRDIKEIVDLNTGEIISYDSSSFIRPQDKNTHEHIRDKLRTMKNRQRYGLTFNQDVLPIIDILIEINDELLKKTTVEYLIKENQELIKQWEALKVQQNLK